jgi:hypothetical protein
MFRRPLPELRVVDSKNSVQQALEKALDKGLSIQQSAVALTCVASDGDDRRLRQRRSSTRWRSTSWRL